jgi:hypothetical protein
MPAHSPIQVRVPPDMRDRWQREAEKRGVSLPEFVRSCVETVLDGERFGPTRAAPRGSTTGSRASVTIDCRNRQRHKKGVRCAYCGVIP